MSFEDVLEGSVKESVSKTLGGDVWRAISFYFSTRVLFKEPDALRSVLGRLFGEVSARVLEKVIAENVLVKVGGTENRPKSSDFLILFRFAKSRFLTSSAVM
jgi:hypothetical protein